MTFQALYILTVHFKFVFCIFHLEFCFLTDTHNLVTHLDECQVILKQTKGLQRGTEQHACKKVVQTAGLCCYPGRLPLGAAGPTCAHTAAHRTPSSVPLSGDLDHQGPPDVRLWCWYHHTWTPQDRHYAGPARWWDSCGSHSSCQSAVPA